MILYTGFRVHGRSCQWLTSCYTKKQYQKTPTWAGNEPGCSACSSRCSEKWSFGYFSCWTSLTLIELSFRYCKVPVKMVSKCWVVAWKWWVIKLLGKIFWQESVRRVDSILGIIFSYSVICIASPARRHRRGVAVPSPKWGRLLAGRMGLAMSSPPGQVQQQPPSLVNLLGTLGHRHAHSTHTTRGCPHLNSYCHCALGLALCLRMVSSSWNPGAFPSWGLSSQPPWRGPTGFPTVVTFWRLTLKQ